MPVKARREVVQMVNLGCAKNVVDSEEILGVLAGDGYGIAALSERPDVVVINTCGFIEAAKQESIDAILSAVERKRRGEIRRVVVTGCLSQRYGAELAREMPEVDAFLGTGQMDLIGDVITESLSAGDDEPDLTLLGSRTGVPTRRPEPLLRTAQILRVPERPHHRWVDVGTRIRSTAPWTAYLKISEGCDHRCTFCAIPSFRGDHASKPLDRVVREAELLARDGVTELNLIAQDSTQYGYDLAGRPLLPTLLRELSQVDGVRWIRLFYCYPSRVNAEVIEAIATTPKVCQYIDMPLQHADDDVLRAMRRPANGGRYMKLLERFREASPDVAIRTTFIAGFPGETDAHFANLEQFVQEARFDRVGVFEYSTEDGTPSASLPGRVPARVKRQRRERLMTLQQQISLERNRAWIGRDIEVLIEESGQGAAGARGALLDQELQPASGRSFRDGPEVDGQVFVAGTEAKPGDYITVRVTDAREYDLVGIQA